MFPKFRMASHPALTLALFAFLAVGQSFAQGLSYRSPSSRQHQTSQTRSFGAHKIQVPRADQVPHQPHGKFYRRPPSQVGANRSLTPNQIGVTGRALREFGGGRFRNGLSQGFGHLAANQYSSQRDRRLAYARGHWATGSVGQIGRAISRAIRP